MKRNAFTWWGMIMVLAGLAPLAVILMFRLADLRDSDHRLSCQSNLKQIAMGMSQYLMDSNGMYPPTNLEEQGWTELLQPYLKKTQLFQCPTESSGQASGTTDYFYNSQLSGMKRRKLTFATSTILLGDGMAEAPANFSLTGLPPDWSTDKNSPAYRHKGGANYAFADGHATWLRPSEITDDKAGSQVNTFAPW